MLTKIKEKVLSFFGTPWPLVIVLLCVVAYFVYAMNHKPPDVIGTSQTIAETEKGVEIAGNKAGYSLDKSQSKQVAQTIREIRVENRTPEYVIVTNGQEAKAKSEQARADNKADFAIVTDKDNPDVEVDLNKIDKDKTVNLNQYNIQAYKKVLRQIEVGRSTDGYTEVGFAISRKITDDGKYIGIGVADEWKDSDNRIWVKAIYTW